MIRRGTLGDVEALTSLRRAMWDEMHPEAPADEAFDRSTRDYLRDALPSGRVRAWIGEADGEPAGLALLIVHEHPPRITGREIRGYITAVYVRPRARRRGIARSMIEAIVASARSEGLRRLELRTSDAGRGVYEAVGFRSLEVLARDLG